MKLSSENNQYESTVTGKKIKMGFAEDAAAHLAELMSSSVYQDKYGSIVREVVSNAIDANNESGSTSKVEVTITAKPALSDGVGYLDVVDYGPGISPDSIENIFTQYFASTKRETNDQIGGFGIGAKSPFAYTPVFSVITRVQGVERTYLMEKTARDRTCTLINEVEVPMDSTGTTIRIPIKLSYDETKFVNAIKEQLILLSNQIIITIPDEYDFVMPQVIDFGEIFCIQYENGEFMEHDGTMLSLGDILYKIPHKDRHGCPVNYVLKFDIGDLHPTLSREGIELTDEANVKIHNKHHAVTNLIENVYVPTQSEACLDLHRLVGQREKQGPVFPGTLTPIKHFKHEHGMARTWTVKTTAEGWPKELDFWKFNQVVQGVFQVSHRYNSRTHKFTTPNGIALVRDVIQQAGYQPHKPLIKSPKDTIAGVWKEWFLETSPLDLEQNIAIITVNPDVRSHIERIYNHGLADLENKEELLDKAEEIFVECINRWLKDKPRVKNYQPSQEYLDNRRNTRKLQKTKGWTADALKQSCPCRVINLGVPRRSTMAYLDMLKPNVVVISAKDYKEIFFPDQVSQPKTFVIVSASNYKRCVAAGAHCWTIDDINRINQRRIRQKTEMNLLHVARTHCYDDADRAVTTIWKSGNHVLNPIPNPIYTNGKIQLNHPYTYVQEGCSIEELEALPSITYNGIKYSKRKMMLMRRNFENIMKRSPCTKLIMSILGSHYNPNVDELYKDLLTQFNFSINA